MSHYDIILWTLGSWDPPHMWHPLLQLAIFAILSLKMFITILSLPLLLLLLFLSYWVKQIDRVVGFFILV